MAARDGRASGMRGMAAGPVVRRDAADHAVQPRLRVLLSAVPRGRPADAGRGGRGGRRGGQPVGGRRPVLRGVARRRAAGGGPGAPGRADRAVRPAGRAPRADQRHAASTTPGASSSPSTGCGSASAWTARAGATATGSTRAGGPAYDRIVRGYRRRCAGTACRSRRWRWSADPRPGSPPSCTTTSSSWAATCSGINIEETEGVNTRSNAHDAAAVTRVLGRAGGGVAAGPADPPARGRVVAAVRGGGARRHGRRPAAPPARSDPDGRATTAR